MQHQRLHFSDSLTNRGHQWEMCSSYLGRGPRNILKWRWTHLDGLFPIVLSPFFLFMTEIYNDWIFSSNFNTMRKPLKSLHAKDNGKETQQEPEGTDNIEYLLYSPRLPACRLFLGFLGFFFFLVKENKHLSFKSHYYHIIAISDLAVSNRHNCFSHSFSTICLLTACSEFSII